MDSSSRKSNKIRDIVRLQQILKKWKKAANTNKSSNAALTTTTTTTTTTANKSIKFLKKTLSFSESSSASAAAAVPKGFVAVCVGAELKRFVIPTEYLGHQMFGILLREAEEEFGFQQEGVLRFPCEVELFQKVLKMMEDKRSQSSPALAAMNGGDDDTCGLMIGDYNDNVIVNCSSNNYSPEAAELHHHPQMCR